MFLDPMCESRSLVPALQATAPPPPVTHHCTTCKYPPPPWTLYINSAFISSASVATAISLCFEVIVVKLVSAKVVKEKIVRDERRLRGSGARNPGGHLWTCGARRFAVVPLMIDTWLKPADLIGGCGMGLWPRPLTSSSMIGSDPIWKVFIPNLRVLSGWDSVSRHLGRNELLPMETNSDLIAEPFLYSSIQPWWFWCESSWKSFHHSSLCPRIFSCMSKRCVYPRLFLALSLQLHLRVTQQDDFPDLLTLFQVWGKFSALMELFGPPHTALHHVLRVLTEYFCVKLFTSHLLSICKLLIVV